MSTVMNKRGKRSSFALKGLLWFVYFVFGFLELGRDAHSQQRCNHDNFVGHLVEKGATAAHRGNGQNARTSPGTSLRMVSH